MTQPERPDFNQAEYVVDDLVQQNGQLTKQLSVLKAMVAERDQFIQANAKLLGLEPAETSDEPDAAVAAPARTRK